MFGYHQNELSGTNLLEFIHPEDLPTIKESILDTIKIQKRFSVDFRIKHKNGNYLYISAKGSLVNDNGTQTILAVGRDITKQKENENKLKQSEELLNKITNQTFIGFAIFQDFEIKYFNPAFSEVIGYSQEEISSWKAREFFNIINLNDRGKIVSLAQKLYSGDNEALNFLQFRVNKKSGQVIWVETQAKTVIHDGKKADMVFIQNITPKMEKQQESEEKFRILFESSPHAVGLINSKGVVVQVNSNVEKIFGYTKDEILGQSFRKFSLFSEKHSKLVFDSFKKLIKGEIPEPQELELHRKDGTIIWISMQASIVRLSNETLFQIITQDISEQRKAKKRLKESEEKYRLISENANDLIIILNKKKVIEYVNKRPLLRYFGYTPEEIIGKELKNFVNPDYLGRYGGINIRELFQKEKKIIELKIRHKKNYYCPVEISISIYIDSNNEPKQLIFVRDTTGRKRVEQKLKGSELRYRLLFESSTEGIASDDLNGTIIETNKAFLDMLGYSLKEFINLSYSQLTPQKWHKKEEEIRKTQLMIKGYTDIYEKELIRKDGTIISVSIRGWLRKNEIGEPTGVWVFVRDITGRKHVEQKLKESEEKYRLISEDADDLISLYDDNFNMEYINEQTHSRHLGYSIERLNDLTFKLSITHRDDVKTITTANRDCFKNGKVSYQIRLKHKNGQYLWFETRGRVFLGKDGKKKVLYVSRDITERTVAEEELKAKELKYRILIENLPQRIFLKDKNFMYISCNNKYAEDLNIKADDIMGKTDYDFYPKELADKFRTDDIRILSKGEAEEIDEEDILNGQERYVRTIKTPIRDKIGNITGLLGIFWDITERRKEKRQLLESEERFKLIFEHAPDAYYLTDLKGKFIYGNKTAENLIGYRRDELIGRNIGKILLESQLPMALNILSKIKKGLKTGPDELIIKHKDGREIPIEIRSHPITINNKALVLGIARDITERKIHENLMVELNQVFFNFTADVKKNIQLLLQTVSKLSKGKIVLYARKFFDKDEEIAQIITSENEIYSHNVNNFKKNYFLSEIFEQTHESPQIFSNLHKSNQLSGDPFIQKYNIKGAYGKNISTQEEYKSAISILYQQNLEVADEDQLILLFVSEAIAIEERRWQLLQKLEEQNKKLSDIDKLKSEFLRRISHELKTPLISIKGYSELILRQNEDNFDIDTISMIGEIVQGCSRLENLIGELLKTSQLETGQIELKTSMEDLSFLIRFTVNELQGLSRTRNQKIIMNVHKNLITRFEKERIHEVVGNLLTNAIKYTPPYGMIEIKSEIKDTYYLVSVKDNGIGFTEEEKEKGFKQFGKIEHYGNGSYISTEGTGLGLYITKKLVELHGGEIWLESEGRNKGSTFYFTLPIIKE